MKKIDPYEAWTFYKDPAVSYTMFPMVFNKKECEDLVSYVKQEILIQPAMVGQGEVRENVRKSNVAFVPPTNFMTPYYQKISDCILNMNRQFYNYDLFGFAEHLQFAEYNAPGGHFAAHIDSGYGFGVRKLSVTIQLSDPNDYDGGDLEIIENSEFPTVMPKDQGTMIVFPSYMLHRVLPVTRGTRHSIVGWVSGPPLR